MELEVISHPFRPGYSGNHNPVNTEVFPVSPLLWVLLFLPHQSIQFRHHRPWEPRSREMNYMWIQVNSLKPVSTWACGYTSKLLEASTKMWKSICLTHIHICCLYIFKIPLVHGIFFPSQQAIWKQWKSPSKCGKRKMSSWCREDVDLDSCLALVRLLLSEVW